jgi:hypothetical protein
MLDMSGAQSSVLSAPTSTDVLSRQAGVVEARQSAEVTLAGGGETLTGEMRAGY